MRKNAGIILAFLWAPAILTRTSSPYPYLVILGLIYVIQSTSISKLAARARSLETPWQSITENNRKEISNLNFTLLVICFLGATGLVVTNTTTTVLIICIALVNLTVAYISNRAASIASVITGSAFILILHFFFARPTLNLPNIVIAISGWVPAYYTRTFATRLQFLAKTNRGSTPHPNLKGIGAAYITIFAISATYFLAKTITWLL